MDGGGVGRGTARLGIYEGLGRKGKGFIYILSPANIWRLCQLG